MLQENEIIASANAVKYHNIEYTDRYVVIVQNRTRRRVPAGFYFEDTGTHIFVSVFYSGIFQHKRKIRQYIVNIVTREWRDLPSVVVERHKPEPKEPLQSNLHDDLIKQPG